MPRTQAFLAAFGVALALCAPARADVFVVNTTSLAPTNDPNACPAIDRTTTPLGDLSLLLACSLTTAVEKANNLDGADEILINLPGNQVLTLPSTLVIDGDLELNTTALVGWTNPQLLTDLVLRAGAGVDELLRVDDGQTQLRDLTLEQGDLEVLLASSRVIFELTTGTSTFAEVISGDGAVEKQGGGTLILTGVNTYAGDTTIAQGTLQGDTESILGGTALDPRDINDNGILIFDQDADDPADFFGEIDGTGRLIKDGPGTLFLRNALSGYSGGTTVEEGTLKGFVGVPGDATQGSLHGNITNDATLVFEQTDPGIYAGNISGNGDVVKNGVPTLTLTGSNQFSKLTINQGIVVGDSQALGGDVDIQPSAQLIFDQADPGTHAGNITGGGGTPPGLGGFSVIKRGAGKLTLTGSNDFDGKASVEVGELEVDTGSLPGDVDVTLSAGTTLSFLQSGNGSYGGVIDGAGALIKRGGGTLSLTRSQLFSGGTTVESGTLELGVQGQGNGSDTALQGNLTLQSGTLAGIGRVVGDVDVASGGRISPGGAAATLRVGSVDFASGSLFAANVDDDLANSDLLQVDNAATIAPGAVLEVTLGGLSLGADFTRTVLSAGGSVAGGPFTLDADYPFFTLALIQDGNSVSVDVTPNLDVALSDFGETPNQAAVAAALEEAQAIAPPGSDLETVFGAIINLTAPELPRALADMSGEQLTEFATTRLAIGDRFHSSLQERIRGVAWSDGEALLAQQQPGAGAPVLAANPLLARALPGLVQGGGAWPVQLGGQSMSSVLDSATSFQPAQGEHGVGGWIDGYGLFGALEGDSGSADLDYTIGGVSLGLDYLLASNWLLGLAGGYAHSDLDFNGLPGSQIAETGQGALYAGYVLPWLQLGASGHFGYSAMSTGRKIRFMDRKSDADFDGWDVGGRVEAALDLAKLGPVEIQPLASFSYTHVQQDEIDESGADSLDLTTDEEDVDSAVSGLGARLHGVFRIFEDEVGDVYFHPELRGRWLHEFGDTERELTARIGGEPGASYQVVGAELPSDSGVFGVSWSVVVARRLHAFADYDVTVSSELLQHGAAVGFKIVW